jgi:prepilin peptidase CpaA
MYYANRETTAIRSPAALHILVTTTGAMPDQTVGPPNMLELAAVPELLAKLLASPRDLVLIALLALAAVIDWRTYRIPNWLSLSGTVFGLGYATLSGPAWSTGLLLAAAGLGAGLLVLLPVYALRVMGAGDVKLMAMVGAIVGFPDILHALLYTLIAGGVAAIGFALYRRTFRRMSSNVADIVQTMAFAAVAGFRSDPALAAPTSVGRLPYGVCIAAGTIAWLIARLLGLA